MSIVENFSDINKRLRGLNEPVLEEQHELLKYVTRIRQVVYNGHTNTFTFGFQGGWFFQYLKRDIEDIIDLRLDRHNQLVVKIGMYSFTVDMV